MAIKIGINGFGRIGRMILRASLKYPEKFMVVGINDPFLSTDYMAYLIKYDTVHGTLAKDVTYDPGLLYINDRAINVFGEMSPKNIPWSTINAEYIADATGVFCTYEALSEHLLAGAKKVVLSAPPTDRSVPTFVMGVNLDMYDPSMHIVSNASCTTNCLAPLAKVINDNFGIVEGLMTTVHATTISQNTVDGTSKKDWRMGRAAGRNIIPASTGAAKSCGEVIPDLKGKLTGMAFRIPTEDVSVVDLTCRLKKPVYHDEICRAIRKTAENELYGILGYTDKMLVSSDFCGDPRTSIFDEKASMMLNETFVKLIAWYDNEWAYSVKLLDLMYFMHEQSKGGLK